jgi:hypothetical protein
MRIWMRLSRSGYFLVLSIYYMQGLFIRAALLVSSLNDGAVSEGLKLAAGHAAYPLA